MENIRKFTETHNKNRVDFHDFMSKVKSEDKEQDDKESQHSD